MCSIFAFLQSLDFSAIQRLFLSLQLFIVEENEDANEYYYQKALALLPFVEDAVETKHKIWCSAILRDKWDSYNINAPQETLQQLTFFKLIDLCFLMGKLMPQFEYGDVEI